MTSCIAVLTYRRLGPLKVFLSSVLEHVPAGVPIAVFEDCANFDDTFGFLTAGATALGYDAELNADAYAHPRFTAYLGRSNQGVAGNSNRALKWFERQAGRDHLLLCNDDLEATGDFTAEYAKAHTDLKVGLFSFCDFTTDEYTGPKLKVLGHELRLIPRMTGMMMSLTRAVLDRIGYFDPAFGRFGDEHCDVQNRARFCGFSRLRGVDQKQIDIVSKTLKSQSTPSTVSPAERTAFDAFAHDAMQTAAARYQTESWYRPFRLLHSKNAAGYNGAGIPVRLLDRLGYTLVIDRDLHDARATL